jgi:poly(hydroxyalkanoate) depolymerase family esterase
MAVDFAGAMRAATKLTLASQPMEATRIIQSALLLGREHNSSQSDLIVEDPSIRESLVSFRPSIEFPHNAATSPLIDIAATLDPGRLPRFGLEALRNVRPRKLPELPEGAQFLNRSYACTAGRRTYKLYIPQRQQRGGKRPLLVMLHGGTQDADDFAAGTRMNNFAEEHGFFVAYPVQCRSANTSLCWNWFKPEDQRRGAGEPSIIAGITEEIVAEFEIDPQRVFIAGLSAGGAMAAVMGATYPDLYAAAGIHSGLPYQCATDLPSAFSAMRGDTGPKRRKRRANPASDNSLRTPTIIFHGDADHIVHASNAAKMVEALAKTGDTVQRVVVPSSSGRTYTRVVTRDQTGTAIIEEWLIHGSGHAWSGGSLEGTYTDPRGPDASREMLRFFLDTERTQCVFHSRVEPKVSP